MKPTYLYIKQHSKTRLKYLGKTVNDPYKYNGSGKRWTNHINKHGKEFIETIWVSEQFTDKNLLEEFALFLSDELDVVNSPSWANLIPENGINGGGDCSQMHTLEIRNKILAINDGVHPFKLPLARQKNIDSITQLFGKPGKQFTNQQSIEKRNNTNLKKHGSKCAANKDKTKSKLTQKNLLNRKEVKIIKALSFIKKYSMPRGWFYKSKSELNNYINELSNIPLISTSKQDKRTIFLNRPKVKLLIIINTFNQLKLGQNWFQKPSNEIDNIFNNIKIPSEDFSLALQLYRQIYQEDFSLDILGR